MPRFCFTGKGPRERNEYAAICHQLGWHSSFSFGRDVDVLVTSPSAYQARTRKVELAFAAGAEIILYEEMERRIRVAQAQRPVDPPALYHAAGRAVLAEGQQVRVVKFGNDYRVDTAPDHAPTRWAEHRVHRTLAAAHNEMMQLEQAGREHRARRDLNRRIRAEREMVGAHIGPAGITPPAPPPEPVDPYKQRRVIDI